MRIIGLLSRPWAVAKASVGKIVGPMIPMYVALFVALSMVTYIPAIIELLLRYSDLID